MTRPRSVTALVAAATMSCAAMAAPAPGATLTNTAPPQSVSTGHSAWGWGNPTPQGQNLAGVAFDGADGYAVGAFGTVLRSDDAGQTWAGLPSGTTDDLNLVQELGPTAVIAAGGCSALESTNSGASFTALPLGLGEPCRDPVAAVAFSDPQHGYVELQDGTLLYTADGGATLQAKSSPPLAGGEATGLAFSSPTTGLAVSSTGLIERTTDGGNSWTQVEAAPDGLNDVTIVNPTLEYAVGNVGQLLSSTDGGATWTDLPLALQGGGAVPDLTSITCADANECLIATADSNELVRTSDGGLTGAKVSVSNDALTSVAYATGSTVVGVGALGATVISGDAGQTFPMVTTNGLSTFVTHGPLTAGTAPGTAYLPGDHGIAATTDSGASWSLLRVPTSQPIESVAFTSAQTGYALDGNGVLRLTDNGGTSWRSFAGNHSPFAALAVATPKTPLLVGPKGIFRSTDGGAGFRKVRGRVRVGRHAGPTVASLHLDAALVAHGTVVAWRKSAGRTPVVVSTDAGRTWRSVPLPPHDAHGSVAVNALSASRLWFLERDNLWATTDGGRHWHAVPGIGHLGEATDVSFSSPHDGVVGFNARLNGALDPPLHEASVLRTTDGGRTWAPEILAGQTSVSSADLLATPTGDLDAIAYGTGLASRPAPLGLFTTAGVPPATSHTKLRVRFARRRMSARALSRAGHRLLVTGHVSPVLSPDESVAVSFRLGRADWRLAQVRVASSGAFRLHIGHVRSSAAVVAQAVGTSAVAGAGTPVARFSVKR